MTDNPNPLCAALAEALMGQPATQDNPLRHLEASHAAIKPQLLELGRNHYQAAALICYDGLMRRAIPAQKLQVFDEVVGLALDWWAAQQTPNPHAAEIAQLFTQECL